VLPTGYANGHGAVMAGIVSKTNSSKAASRPVRPLISIPRLSRNHIYLIDGV
jgi:hypothetical protein